MAVANCAMIYKFMMATCKNRSGDTGSTNQALSKSAFKGTVMLITVSIAFIVLTGPVSVIFFITETPNPYVTEFVHILPDLNHAINGVLYCVVGSRFRNELINTFCCRKRQGSQSNISMSGSDNTRLSNISVSYSDTEAK